MWLALASDGKGEFLRCGAKATGEESAHHAATPDIAVAMFLIAESSGASRFVRTEPGAREGKRHGAIVVEREDRDLDHGDLIAVGGGGHGIGHFSALRHEWKRPE
jgi:hypothetical protein